MRSGDRASAMTRNPPAAKRRTIAEPVPGPTPVTKAIGLSSPTLKLDMRRERSSSEWGNRTGAVHRRISFVTNCAASATATEAVLRLQCDKCPCDSGSSQRLTNAEPTFQFLFTKLHSPAPKKTPAYRLGSFGHSISIITRELILEWLDRQLSSATVQNELRRFRDESLWDIRIGSNDIDNSSKLADGIAEVLSESAFHEDAVALTGNPSHTSTSSTHW